jgi:uncharacterized protein YwgA
MGRNKRFAIVAALTDALHERGSWCGETHLQKAIYLLEEVVDVPLDYEFVLYKHGPFSFDLRDELTEMRADGLLALEPRPFPYGPSLKTTPSSSRLEARFPKTLRTYDASIQLIANHVGARGVTELEKLATAVFVKSNDYEEDLADRIHELKPHVSRDEARRALEEAEALFQAAGA